MAFKASAIDTTVAQFVDSDREHTENWPMKWPTYIPKLKTDIVKVKKTFERVLIFFMH